MTIQPPQSPCYEVRLRGEVLSQYDDILVALPASRQLGAGAALYRIADGVVLARTHNTHLSAEEKKERRARYELANRRGKIPGTFSVERGG